MTGRRIVTGILVVLASIGVLGSTLAVWGARTVFNTDRFTAVIGDLTDEPVAIDALSTYATDQVMHLVIADRLVEDDLSSGAESLVPIGGARSRVEETVSSLLASAAAQQLLLATIRGGHGEIMQLLEGDGLFGDGINVIDGRVTLNTLPLFDPVLHALQDCGVISPHRDLPELSVDGVPSEQIQDLAASFGTTLPADFGQLTAYESRTLDQGVESCFQVAVVTLKRSPVALPVVTVVLIALALVLSDRRWRTVAQLGLGIAIAMLIGRAGIDRLLDTVQSRVTVAISDRGPTPAGATTGPILEALTGWLSALTGLVAVAGLVLAVVGFLAGRVWAWAAGRGRSR
jgi:hypothetical protein